MITFVLLSFPFLPHLPVFLFFLPSLLPLSFSFLLLSTFSMYSLLPFFCPFCLHPLQVLLENQRLEDQLREEKFQTTEAEEMRNLLAQKKGELESMVQDMETRLEEQEEFNQLLQAEKTKLLNAIQGLEDQ